MMSCVHVAAGEGRISSDTIVYVALQLSVDVGARHIRKNTTILIP